MITKYFKPSSQILNLGIVKASLSLLFTGSLLLGFATNSGFLIAGECCSSHYPQFSLIACSNDDLWSRVRCPLDAIITHHIMDRPRTRRHPLQRRISRRTNRHARGGTTSPEFTWCWYWVVRSVERLAVYLHWCKFPTSQTRISISNKQYLVVLFNKPCLHLCNQVISQLRAYFAG